MDCPACASEIGSEPIDSYKSYKLYHCHACDLMFWHPLKGADSEWYETFYGKPIDLTPFRSVQTSWEQNNFLKDMPAQGGSLLDIGCGVGDFLFAAHNAGYSVTGIDFSPKFVEIVHQRFGFERIYPLTLHDFVAKNPQNKYDVLTFFEVLEHLDNVTDFLQLVRKLLRPGGYVSLSTPDRERWRFGSKWFLSHVSQERDFPPHHLTRWNLAALTNLFEKHGFSIVAIKREPLMFRSLRSFAYGGWLLVSSLGIQHLAVVFALRMGTRNENRTGTPQKSTRGAMGSIIIKWGAKFFYEGLIPLVGLVALPLWLLLRRQGGGIYLLATTKEQADPATITSLDSLG